jgi:hypothetical protein
MPPSTTTTAPALVGLVASGGFVKANRRDKLSRTPGLPLVGLVGIGGLASANRRTTLSTSDSRGRRALVGLVGFGGCLTVNGEPNLWEIAARISPEPSAEERAEALLSTLRELGISVELEASGALRVTPASLLTQELRDAIKTQRDAMADLLDAAGLRDDRRRCSECRHFRPYGGCAEAARGNMPGVSPRMIPMKDVLQRCDWFKAHRDFGGDY